MDVVDVSQLKGLVQSLSVAAAILVVAIFYFAWKYEMHNVSVERLRDQNSVKEVLIEACTNQFLSGKFSSVNDCLGWLQSRSTEYKQRGHRVLGPTDYYEISVKAKQRAQVQH